MTDGEAAEILQEMRRQSAELRAQNAELRRLVDAIERQGAKRAPWHDGERRTESEVRSGTDQGGDTASPSEARETLVRRLRRAQRRNAR